MTFSRDELDRLAHCLTLLQQAEAKLNGQGNVTNLTRYSDGAYAYIERAMTALEVDIAQAHATNEKGDM